jgi:hypothetical protein
MQASDAPSSNKAIRVLLGALLPFLASFTKPLSSNLGHRGLWRETRKIFVSRVGIMRAVQGALRHLPHSLKLVGKE